MAWIEAFGTTEDAQFVYNAWLNAGEQRDLIDRHILAWIEAFGTTEVARFVYRAWLDAGGQRDLIDRHVQSWIEAFGATEDAQFVYKAWLDAGGQRDLIDRHVLAWIEAFGATELADFVYRAWLSAGGDFEAISEPCIAWFHAHSTSYQSSFLIKYITQRTDLPSATLHIAIKWCTLFADREEVVWQATSLLIRHANSAEAVAVVRAFLANVQFLELSRLSQTSGGHGEDGAKLSQMVLSGLGLSLGVLALDERDRDELNTVHARLLAMSTIYGAAQAAGKAFVYPALIHHVAELIECGLIDLNRDRAALVRFAGWMRGWPEDAAQDLELAIARLRLAAPSPLWDGIPAHTRIEENRKNQWEWKDNWEKEWNAAQGDPDRSAVLAEQALEWLSEFDLAQRGWTSVWKALWNVNGERYAAPTVLNGLAEEWLQIVAPEHPRWATIWGELWSVLRTDPEENRFLVAQARAWLSGEGSRVEWKLVLRELWSRRDFSDGMIKDCVRRRMPLTPDADLNLIVDELTI